MAIPHKVLSCIAVISFLALFFSVVVFAYGTYREVLTWYDKIKFNNFLFLKPALG